LCHNLTLVRALDYTFLGFPLCLKGPHYPRHTYFFSVGFCFPADVTNLVIKSYQPVIAKFGCILETLESESSFLSEKEGRDKLPGILEKIFNDVRTTSEVKDLQATPANVINLKRFCHWDDCIPDVDDHQVPVVCNNVDVLLQPQFDLVLKKVLPYIDGVNYVKRISILSGVDLILLKKMSTSDPLLWLHYHSRYISVLECLCSYCQIKPIVYKQIYARRVC